MKNADPIPTIVANAHYLGDPELDIYAEYFKTASSTARDLFNLMSGPRLGGGVSRVVHEAMLNDKYVLKFEYGSTFQNVMEWEIWSAVEKDDSPNSARNWLAPCQSISPNGLILVQRKTIPLRQSELPEKIPSWMCDPKVGNWGLLDGKPVLHDYGYTHFLGTHTLNRLKKNHKHEAVV